MYGEVLISSKIFSKSFSLANIITMNSSFNQNIFKDAYIVLCTTPNIPINTNIKKETSVNSHQERSFLQKKIVMTQQFLQLKFFCKIRKHAKRQIDALHKCLDCKLSVLCFLLHNSVYIYIYFVLRARKSFLSTNHFERN